MALLDLLKKEHTTAKITNAADAFGAAAEKEVMAMSSGTHNFKSGNPVFNFFKNKFGKGAPKVALDSGATHDQWITWLEDKFGLGSGKTVVGTVEHIQNETRLEGALNRVGKLDQTALNDLEKNVYNKEVAHLKSLRKTLEEAENMAAGAADGIFPKIEEQIIKLNDSFASIASQKFSATGKGGMLDLAGLKAEMNKALAGSGDLLAVATKGANKDSLVANIVNPETGKLEELVLAAEGESVRLTEVTSALRDQRRFLFEAPKSYVKNLTDEIGKMKGELTKSEELVDKVGKEVLKKPGSAFAAAAEAAAKVGGETAKDVAQSAKNLVSGEVGGVGEKAALYAKDAEVASKAKDLNLLSEEAYKEKGTIGKFMADAKANWAGTATKDAKGVIQTAEASGIVKKGIRAGSVGAGVIMMGSGLKDIFTPSVGADGMETDTSWVKIGAELAGGAALAGAGLLMGAGARGRI